MKSIGTQSYVKNMRSQSFLPERHITHEKLHICIITHLGQCWISPRVVRCVWWASWAGSGSYSVWTEWGEGTACGNTHSHIDLYGCTLMPACTVQVLISSHMLHTCLSLLHWSWGGTRSRAVWRVVVLDDCGLWQRTLPVAVCPVGLTAHTSAEKNWFGNFDIKEDTLRISNLTHLKCTRIFTAYKYTQMLQRHICWKYLSHLLHIQLLL